MTTKMVIAALSLLAAAVSSNAAAQDVQPSSPAAEALQAWVDVYNRQDAIAMKAFARERYGQEWLAQSPPQQLAIAYRNTFANYGALQPIGWAAHSPISAEAVTYSPALDACIGLFVEMEGGPRDRIGGVYFEPFTHRPCPETDGPATWRDFPAALRSYLDALAAAGRFNGVVLVSRQGRTLVYEARGAARLSPARTNTRRTRFELASVSKLFTAVAIARLAEQGRLTFDDTVADLIPDYPNPAVAAQVTVAQLLSHTFGVEDYYRSGAIFADTHARLRLEEFWPLFAARPLAFEPGVRYDYSNSNYMLLGSIVEHVTGDRFESFVEREIFRPMRMTSSCYCRAGEAGGIATPLTVYTAVAGPGRRVSAGGLMQVPADAARPARSAGYAVSSARDLARFAQGLLGGNLLRRETLERMLGPQAAMDDGGDKGLGLEMYHFGGVRVVGHGGSSWGVSTQLDMYPDEEIVVVILSNIEASARPLFGTRHAAGFPLSRRVEAGNTGKHGVAREGLELGDNVCLGVSSGAPNRRPRRRSNH